VTKGASAGTRVRPREVTAQFGEQRTEGPDAERRVSEGRWRMDEQDPDPGRRRLLTTGLPLATIACLGCRGLAAQSLVAAGGTKFQENPGMTTEETYAFFYATFIPVLQALSKEMGPERFLAALTKAASDNTSQLIAAAAKDAPTRDMKGWSALFQNMLGTPPFNKAVAYEVVEQSDRVLELKFTACLPAKLLRAMNAADIGYAFECSGSEAAAKAFNPKITASNPRNMMKGDSFCIERFVLET
jgi:hypothetical protein